MTDIDPVHRLEAKEAKDRLGTIVNSMAPESLLIKPDTKRISNAYRDIPVSLPQKIVALPESTIVEPLSTHTPS